MSDFLTLANNVGILWAITITMLGLLAYAVRRVYLDIIKPWTDRHFKLIDRLIGAENDQRRHSEKMVTSQENLTKMQDSMLRLLREGGCKLNGEQLKEAVYAEYERRFGHAPGAGKHT